MLFLLKAFLWFVTKPFRIFNKKLRSKFKESIYKPFKFLFKVLLIFVSFSTLIIITVQVVSDVKPNGGDTVTVKRVDSEDEVLYPDNPNGTNNGLNLLLINKIETEGYVKEMLSMYRDSSMGLLDNSLAHLSVEGLLGIQVNETGTYDGIPIPSSYIPFKGGKIMWKESYGNLPAEALTLYNINHNVIDSSYRGGHSVSGGLPYDINGINPTTGGSADDDINVFQVRYTRFGMFGGSFPSANVNGWKESSGRVSDPFYLPDNLSYINTEVQDIVSSYLPHDSDDQLKSQLESLDTKLLNLMYSIYHNGGPAILKSHAGLGVYFKYSNKYSFKGYESDFIQSFKEILSDFESFNTNVKPKMYSSPNSRVYATVGLVTQGWSLTNEAFNFLYNNYKDSLMTQAYNEIKGDNKSDSEVKSILKSAISPLPFDESTCSSVYGLNKYNLDGNSYGSMFKVRDRKSSAYNAGEHQVLQFLNVINVGHIQSAIYGGYYIYGAMLKYAGVDVDPTNPDTYMNNIPDGEWKPSGDTAWMSEYGIDPKQIGEKRTKLLNEAYKWLGSWYAWGGTNPPVKDENGVWKHPVHVGNGYYDPGFDCSRYTQYCTQEALGIDISRTTYTQIVNSNLTTIDQSEAKPGDLVYYYKNSPSDTHHVAIFLKNNGDGTDVIMHAPQTGDVIKIANRYNTPSRTVYRRINGIDN